MLSRSVRLACSLDSLGSAKQIRQRVSAAGSLFHQWRVVGGDGRVSLVHDRMVVEDRAMDEKLSGALFGYVSRGFVDSGLARISRQFFLPVGYPHCATARYTEFVRLNVLQVGCISLSRVLSTQAMLLAVGIGQAGALPMAAVLNWILKDGLGHIGSILIGTSINTKFDSDPKRYKFLSVFLGQGANLLGIMSLARPGLFLLLTSLGSALSRVGTLAFTSSRARIYENFATAGNLGDLIRCSQAQSTLATILGTAVGVILSPVVGGDVTSLVGVFIPVSVATHVLAYKAVSVIELRTLNGHRMELVVDSWLKTGKVPSFQSVAKDESFILRRPIFGVHVNPRICSDVVTSGGIQRLSEDGFVVRSQGGRVSLYVRDSASTQQALRGMFEACIQAHAVHTQPPDRPGRQTESWDAFYRGLVGSGWDLSVAFIDNASQRVSIS